MIRRARKQYSMDEVLSLLDPLIGEWFSSKYSTLTEPQSYAIPLIHSGRNVLISSPTGSGKTLTAFMSVINELFLLAKEGKLEDRVYCVYVSPLKALANDIHRNLEVPLEEINSLARKEGVKVPKIRVAVRSGDTSTSERQKMLRKPPHIFITTPESLALVLTAPKFRESFKGVRYVIVDEIHEMANNKRGVMLSLTLERLRYLAGDFQRIGLSATQAPIEEIAKFLVGYDGDEPRDVDVVEVESRKKLDLKVITPVEDLTMVPYEVANEKMYDMLVDIINRHRTTLIFTNTRSGTEHVAYKLKERGIEGIEAHHGSLSKETRLRVERELKEGKLKAVISSTSLELGIDIGYIDIVVQIGSPKSIAKGLQRIGRSGHAYGATAKGRFLVFDPDELVECTTLVKCAYDGKIDRVRIPKNSLDVLAQTLVGMSIERRWKVEEAYELIKSSYCYHELPREKFIQVLRYLGGYVLGDTVYSKIWFDEEEGVFGRKRSSRMIYFMNMGTIPDEADYSVIDHEGKRLGTLSEKFVERLEKGDVFILGARSYEVLSIRSGRVMVRDATGRRPTVPSWVGEMLPRSFDLSIEVGKFREVVERSIRERGENATVEMLMKDYYLDYRGARSVVSYISQGMYHVVPTHRRVVIEGYVDSSNKYNIIFHFPFGRRVNDALSRAYAQRITERYGLNVGISVTDDAFMLTLKRKVNLEEIKGILRSEELEDALRKAIFNTELFKQRFRHVASRSFMVLRKYKGRGISVARQQLRSDKILRLLGEIPDFPVMEETFNEIFNIVMDLPNALEVLRGIEEGRIEVRTIPYSSTPSVFAHNIILSGISDIVLMEDRSALLKELHMRLLERVIPREEMESMLEESQVVAHFHNKFRIRERKDIITFLNLSPGADVLRRRGINLFDYSEIPAEELSRMVEELISSGEIVSVYTTRLLWTTPQNLPVFATLYAREAERTLDFEGEKTAEEMAKEKGMKVSEVREILRDMERAYLVGRKVLGNRVLWYRRERVTMERDYAMEILIRNLLYFRAPLTFEEIVYSLHLPEEDVRRVLKFMVEEGEVVKGVFLIGYGEQYMLRDDLNSLRESQGMDSGEVQRHRFSKIVRRMSLREFFDTFLVMFSPDSCRERGCMEEFLDARDRGEILYGRFMRNSLCYTHVSNIPLLLSVYRREELRDEEERILSEIALLGSRATPSKISEMSTLSSRKVKKILEKLERNLYVHRKLTPRGYTYSLITQEPEDTVEEFLERVLSGYGPLTAKDVEHLTALPLKEKLSKFRKISSRGKIYYTVEDVHLRGEGEAILPYTDPYVYPRLNEIYDSLGELLTHVYVKDGEIRATLSLEDRVDSVYVERIVGDKNSIEALKYPTVILPFEVQGFKKVGDYWLKGDVEEIEDIVPYILWKSHIISGRKLRNTLDVAKLLPCMHSDMETIRAYKSISIDKYYRSELVYETVDLWGNTCYAVPKHISILRAIKGVEMDRDMEVILRIFQEKKKLSLRELMEESPLGRERTENALLSLYHGNYVAKHPGGYIFVDPIYTRDYAMELLLEILLNAVGVVNPILVEEMSNGHLDRYRAWSILSTFKTKKILVDDMVYHIPQEDAKNLKGIEIYDDIIVLDPKDPVSLAIFHIKSVPFQGFTIFREGKFVGVVSGRVGKRGTRVSKFSSHEAKEAFISYFS